MKYVLKGTIYFVFVLVLLRPCFAQPYELIRVVYNNMGGYVIEYENVATSTQHVGFVVPGDQISPTVSVEVSRENNAFVYNYTITNGMDAAMGIYEFDVRARAAVYDKGTPDATWVFDYIPNISMHRWTNAKGNPLAIGLLPGKSLGGFLFVSEGLPSIKKSLLSNLSIIDFPDDNEIPEELIPTVTELSVGHEYIAILTVGPADAPVPFVDVEFVDLLIEYLDTSDSLGWIPSQSTVNEIEAKLISARQKLVSADKIGAANELTSVLMTLENLLDGDGEIQSEAYSLLKYNSEFLLEQLADGAE